MALYQNIASMARRHCHTIFSPIPNLTLQNVLVARMLLFFSLLDTQIIPVAWRQFQGAVWIGMVFQNP